MADEGLKETVRSYALDVEAGGVVRVVVLDARHFLVADGEELVVVEVAGVAGDAVVVAHVDGLGHLLAGNKCFVEFFTVARSNNFHFCIGIFWIYLTIEFL